VKKKVSTHERDKTVKEQKQCHFFVVLYFPGVASAVLLIEERVVNSDYDILLLSLRFRRVGCSRCVAFLADLGLHGVIMVRIVPAK
jgi:hypothetical protein